VWMASKSINMNVAVKKKWINIDKILHPWKKEYIASIIYIIYSNAYIYFHSRNILLKTFKIWKLDILWNVLHSVWETSKISVYFLIWTFLCDVKEMQRTFLHFSLLCINTICNRQLILSWTTFTQTSQMMQKKVFFGSSFDNGIYMHVRTS